MRKTPTAVMQRSKQLKHTQAKILMVLVVLIAFVYTGCSTLPGRAGYQYQEPFSEQRTISVQGTGIVTAIPDTASLSITISELGKTTKEAQSAANKKIAEVLDILSRAGVEREAISTAVLSYYPEYEWRNNERVLTGQRARQTLAVTFKNLGENAGKPAAVIDALGDITGIEISSINFDLADKSRLYTEARELAFAKAKQKAEEYASFSSMVLTGPITINENSLDYGYRAAKGLMAAPMAEAAMANYTPTDIPSGEIEVTAYVSVVFTMELQK